MRFLGAEIRAGSAAGFSWKSGLAAGAFSGSGRGIDERNELIVRLLARQPAWSSFGFNYCESHHRGGLLRWTKIPRDKVRVYIRRARLMPVNITLGRHLWEAEVVWERRYFWMDASKAAAWKSVVMLVPPETMKALNDLA